MGFKQTIIAKKLNEELKIKDGRVSVDENSCDACRGCLETCPHNAIEMTTLSNTQVKNLSFKGRLKVKFKGNEKAHINQDQCTACGLCMKQCHEFAIPPAPARILRVLIKQEIRFQATRYNHAAASP